VDGSQYFATISLADWVRAAGFLATERTAHGAYNLAGPGTTTNAEWTRVLARRLRRPAVLRVPAPVVRLAGPPSTELLGSCRVEPERLLAAGFEFRHPTLEERVTAALRR
jgi:NAD dependent epimerase/dehydratase family enzyme